MLGFASSVRHNDFERLVRDRLNVSETVYFFGFVCAIDAAMRYHMQTALKDKVRFVFDKQGPEFLRARDAFDHIRHNDPYLREYVAGSPKEETDDDVLPLQAADYLAWQMRRIYADRDHPAGARRLALFPPGQYETEEGDIPVLTFEVDAAFLQQIGDKKTVDDLRNLDAVDMPAPMKDCVRRFLTARLRGEPAPEGDRAGRGG